MYSMIKSIILMAASWIGRVKCLVLPSIYHSSTLDTLFGSRLKLDVAFYEGSWSKKYCLARLNLEIQSYVMITGTKVQQILHARLKIANLGLINKNEYRMSPPVFLIYLYIVIARLLYLYGR
jgi:hypothetical protein